MASIVSPKTCSLTGSELYKTYDPSIIQAQNVQRLRINRVAIIQMLKVEHILPKLLQNNVLTEKECKIIQSGKTHQDRARNLLDALPAKGKEADWYRNFRDALKFPETRSLDIKKKYQIIIGFLDNTLIQIPPKPPAKPKAPVSPIDSGINRRNYPRYEPLPSISDGGSPDKTVNISRVSYDDREIYHQQEYAKDTGIEEKEKGMVEGNIPETQNKDQEKPQPPAQVLSNDQAKEYFHKEIPIPENYKSLIEEPTEHFKMLSESSDNEDQKLMEKEMEVLQRVKAVEVAFALQRRKQLPEGLPLCFSKPVEDMLQDYNTNHLYFKYFQKLYQNYYLDVLEEIAASYIEAVNRLETASDEEVRSYVVTIGFGLYDFLQDYGQFNRAENVLLELMKYLSSYADLDNWMALWEGLVKMMSACNTNIQFQETSYMYTVAEQMANKIKMVSFGLDLLDESQLYTELSIMMREQGSIGPSFHWAQRAIKEVEAGNHRGIVDALCNAVLSYCAKWNVKKAEQLAIQAIRYAKELFGLNSPMYVKALLHFVYYSNEFRQDEMGLEVAKEAITICEKIYGGASNIQTALVHEALAKALVVRMDFSDNTYLQHVEKAWKIASEVIPAQHPRLATFKYTMAQMLQWKAMQVPFHEKQNDLMCAETEAKDSLNFFKQYWGTYSIKTAQAYSLLGQIYAKMDRTESAEEMLLGAYTIYMNAVSNNSNLQCLIKATLGTFYRTIDKPLEAIDLLKDCVQNADSSGVYVKWIHMSYESLVTLYRATNQLEEAQQYELALAEWMKKNPKFESPVSWQQLHQAPVPLDEFCQTFFTLASKLKNFTAERGLRNYKANKLQIEAIQLKQ